MIKLEYKDGTTLTVTNTGDLGDIFALEAVSLKGVVFIHDGYRAGAFCFREISVTKVD